MNNLTHHDGLPTERAALARVEPHLSTMRLRILGSITNAGDDGVTPDEWADANRALINTVRRRFTDLWKDGHIRHHPEERTRLNAAGNECVVWVLGRDPIGQSSRGTRLAEALRRIEALEAQVRSLGGTP